MRCILACLLASALAACGGHPSLEEAIEQSGGKAAVEAELDRFEAILADARKQPKVETDKVPGTLEARFYKDFNAPESRRVTGQVVILDVQDDPKHPAWASTPDYEMDWYATPQRAVGRRPGVLSEEYGGRDLLHTRKAWRDLTYLLVLREVKVEELTMNFEANWNLGTIEYEAFLYEYATGKRLGQYRAKAGGRADGGGFIFTTGESNAEVLTDLKGRLRRGARDHAMARLAELSHGVIAQYRIKKRALFVDELADADVPEEGKRPADAEPASPANR